MKTIEKQIAKYIKDVACGYGLKNVHVYIKFNDKGNFSRYAFTSSVDDSNYAYKLGKTVKKILAGGIFVANYYADTIREMKKDGWKFLI